MSLEETIASLLAAQLAPMVDQVRRLTAEVDQLRRALPTQLVSIQDAASQLGVSVDTVKRRIKDGTIPVRRYGRSVRVDIAAAQRAPTEQDVARGLRQISDPR